MIAQKETGHLSILQLSIWWVREEILLSRFTKYVPSQSELTAKKAHQQNTFLELSSDERLGYEVHPRFSAEQVLLPRASVGLHGR